MQNPGEEFNSHDARGRVDGDVSSRTRALSHAEYLQRLHRPSDEEVRRISAIQQRREGEIDGKYHSAEAHEAATKIQKAYRGHRARRELNGLTLDPSARWVEIIREWKFQMATATLYEPASAARLGSDGRPRASSDVAKLNWQRVGTVAERAGAGDVHPSELAPGLDSSADLDRARSLDEADSMMMDQRYFLEMVDQKHRYGTNLLVYHEEWLRSKTPQNFFYWLDRGDGRHVDLPGCSREKLERERIRYLSKDERRDYLVRVDEEGKLRWQKNDELITTSVDRFKDSMAGIVPKSDSDTPTFKDKSVTEQLAESRHFARQMIRRPSGNDTWHSDISDASESDTGEGAQDGSEHTGARKAKKKIKKKFHVSPATILNHLLRATVKPGTWIYVADTVGRLYVGIKSSGSFQHASFLSGARISSAGSIGIDKGQLVYLSPLSGHYRPTTKSFRSFIDSLNKQGADLSQARVSKAYEVLQGMEYYGKTKKGVDKVVHHKGSADGDSRKSKHLDTAQGNGSNAELSHSADGTEKDEKKEQRRRLGSLMGDLRIHRRSDANKDKSQEP